MAARILIISIVNRNADGVMVLDMDGVVRFINPAAEALFGRSAGALTGEIFGLPLLGEDARIISALKGRYID